MIALHTTSLNWGGSEGNAIALATAFHQQGIPVGLIVDREPYFGLEVILQSGVRVEALDVTASVSAEEYRKKLGLALGALRAEVLHCHIWERRLQAFRTAHELGIEVVATLHNTIRGTWLHRFGVTKNPMAYRRFREPFFKYNPVVLNISDRSQRNCRRALHKVHRSKRVYLGVNLPDRAADPAAHGQAPTFFWVGSMISRKRPLLAVRIWTDVLKSFPKARLVMVGGGELSEQVARAAAPLGEAVQLLGNDANWKEKALQAQGLLHTGTYEGIPTVVLEAMARGLPIVATSSGATDEAVSNGVSGFLAKEDDQTGLASAVRSLVGEPCLRKAMGTASLDIVRRKFRFGTHCDNVLGAYRQFCGVSL
jgi:glycosyltransferase involved in cell wall biosynthesis